MSEAAWTEVVRLVEAADRELEEERQLYWLERLDTEQAAIAAAFEACLAADDGESALRITAGLSRYWIVRGRFAEGAGWLRRALCCGREVEGILRAQATNAAALMAWELADPASATAYAGESLEIGRRLDDSPVIVRALRTLIHLAMDAGDLDEAGTLARECLACCEASGDLTGIHTMLHQLGDIAGVGGDADAARSYYERSLSLSRAQGDRLGIAKTSVNLAHLDWKQGQAGKAVLRYAEALELCAELGNPYMPPFFVVYAGMILAQRDRPEAAARLFGLGETLRESSGIPFYDGDREEYESCKSIVERALGTALPGEWDRGRRMTLCQAAGELRTAFPPNQTS